MTDCSQLAWVAAGSPQREALVPGPRTEAWASVRARLEAQCSDAGVTQRIRTPGVLWGLMKGAFPRLCGGGPGRHNVGDLVRGRDDGFERCGHEQGTGQ